MWRVCRFLWKCMEGGLMGHLCKDLKFDETSKTRRQKVSNLRWCFMDSQHRNKSYAWWFFACELLNMANVVVQWFILDYFLGGAFRSYGAEFLHYFDPKEVGGSEVVSAEHVDPSEVVFPKVIQALF